MLVDPDIVHLLMASNGHILRRDRVLGGLYELVEAEVLADPEADAFQVPRHTADFLLERGWLSLVDDYRGQFELFLLTGAGFRAADLIQAGKPAITTTAAAL